MRMTAGFFLVFVFLFNYIAYGQESDMMIDINDHSTVMLIIDPEDGRIKDANGAALDFYGYTYDELVGMPVSNINLLSDEEVRIEMDQAVKEERKFFTFKHRLADGSVRDVEVYTSPISIGGKTRLLSIIHDITAKVEAEERAAKNRVIVLFLIGLFLVSINIFLLKVNNLRRYYKDLSMRYDALFSNMNDGVAYHEMVVDEEGNGIDYNFLEVNEAFERIAGVRKEAIIGKSIREILPDIETTWIEICGKIASQGGLKTIEEYYPRLGKYLNVTIYSHEQRKFFIVFSDVTEQTLARQAIEKERALLKTTLYSLGDAVITTDREGTIEMMNKVASEVTGWQIERAIGQKFCDVVHIMEQRTEKDYVCNINDVIMGKAKVDLTNGYLLVDAHGVRKPVELNAAPIIDGYEYALGMVVVFRDASEKVENLEKITFLSYHDQLTGLYNRHFFEEELSRLDNNRHYPISLLMVDVNGLKLTNDAFGHQMGDQLLKTVAHVLKEVCREEDIIGRIGGDEFVVLLPDTNKKSAANIMNRIYAKVSQSKIKEIILSVSIGLATKTNDGTSMSNIFAEAEEDMYRKKLTESQRMRNETIEIILRTLYESNPREKVHSEAVSRRMGAIARVMGLKEDEIKQVELVGHLYDIGKIGVSHSLLEKKGTLSYTEYDEVKKHPEIGYHILKSVNKYGEIAEYALNHHEYMDGTGYPRGLKGDEIPLMVRALSLADAFEAMLIDAPYRKALTKEEALEELIKYSGSRYDPELIVLLKQTID